MLIHLFLALAAAASFAGQPEELVRMSQQAKELMAAGKFADAVPLYQSLVQAMPGNPGLMLNLGMAQHMAGQDRAAIAQFERVLKLEPQAFPALAMMGNAWMRLGRPSSAVPPLRSAVRLQPANAGVQRLLAGALSDVGQHAEAVVHFRELTKLEPRDSPAWYGLGRSYEAIAQQAFNRLASSAPGSAWWFALIAESRIRHKQNSSAFYFYRQALAKNPRLRGAHSALAEIYRDTGHADWAGAEDKQEAALGNPDCAAAPAECKFRTGHYDDVLTVTSAAKSPEALYWRAKASNVLASEAFGKLAALGPSVPLHRFQAEQHRTQGRYKEAIGELRSALALKPGDIAIEQEIANTVYLSRDYTAAEPLLREMLKKQPDVAENYFLLGDTLLQLQRTDEGIPLLRAALERNPKLLPAHSALGRALMQAGEAQKAIPHLQAALPIDEDGSLHYQLMRAAQTSGNAALAAQMLEKYQRLQKANEAAKKELEEQAEIKAPESP
jgi:tetratricopeptide (TPR) repeat protein